MAKMQTQSVAQATAQLRVGETITVGGGTYRLSAKTANGVTLILVRQRDGRSKRASARA